MQPETHLYRQYEIQIIDYPDGYQAAIYPRKRGMPVIDWESKPIRSPNVTGALSLAKDAINAALSHYDFPSSISTYPHPIIDPHNLCPTNSALLAQSARKALVMSLILFVDDTCPKCRKAILLLADLVARETK
jgi:hypothetical protein